MHNVCLGMVRDLVEMTFSDGGGEYKKRRHGHPLISSDGFNDEMLRTRVPSEFQRTTRRLSQGSWKAEESRNLLLFLFPIMNKYVVTDIIEISTPISSSVCSKSFNSFL